MSKRKVILGLVLACVVFCGIRAGNACSPPPVAVLTAEPNDTVIGVNVVFDGNSSYTHDDETIVKYEWDFDGNGTYDYYETADEHSDGLFNGITTHAYTNTYGGTFNVKLRVTDNRGLTDVDTAIMYVNRLPVAILTAAPEDANTGDTITFDGNDSYDPDGSIVKYEWDWTNDGIYDCNKVPPCDGIATHSYGSSGVYTVKLRVTDNRDSTWTDMRKVFIDWTCSTYYVDPTGNDDANGLSEETAWQTVKYAVTKAEPGDTIKFREGLYRQTKQLEGEFGYKLASPSHRLTLKSYQGETAVITCMQLKDNPNDWQLVDPNDPNRPIYYTVVLDGADPDERTVESVSNCSQGGIPLKLMTYCDSNGGPDDLTGPGQWVRNVPTDPDEEARAYVWSRDGGNPGSSSDKTEISEFDGGGWVTIRLDNKPNYPGYHADYITLEDLVIEGGHYPIQIFTDHIELRRCIFRNCWGDGIKVEGYTISNDPEDPYFWNSEHGLIEDCNIYNFGESGIDVTGGDYWIVRGNEIYDSVIVQQRKPYNNGIISKNNSIETLIENNEIYNLANPSSGISIGGDGVAPAAVGFIVRNNILRSFSGTHAIQLMAAENCSFYNNLIYDCNLTEALVSVYSQDVNDPERNIRNCFIKNNIFFRNIVNNDGHSYAYYQKPDSRASSDLHIDYNRIDPDMTYWWNNTEINLSNWRSTFGFDVNSITDEPTFADVDNYDFYPLNANSLQVDAGDPNTDPNIVGTLDYDGNDRFIDGDSDANDFIDIGPYEYDPN